MAVLGREAASQAMTSADIVDGAFTLNDLNFTDVPANLDITGTIDKNTMRLAEGVTVIGDVTISDDLVLAKLSDDGVGITMTTDGTTRTITGSGSIESTTIAQTHSPSLTGMTGTLSDSVTNAGLYTSIAIICEEQPNGTNGGAFTNGSWITRRLNTKIYDADNLVSFGSQTDNGDGSFGDKFILVNGTYSIEWHAPAMRCGRHVSRLREVQTPETIRFGQAMMVNTGDSHSSSPSSGFAVITVSSASNNTFEIQHQCSDTRSTYGLGHYSGLPTAIEVFTQVKILKHRD